MAAENKKGKTKSNEEILEGFQTLRAEQRHMVNKLSEMEMELLEHKMVIESLKTIEESRKCFRMIGGVLCERTVKDVLPNLISNSEQLAKYVDTLTEQLKKKGLELNEYKEKFNIRIRGHDELPTSSESSKEETNQKARTGNVLVVNNPV
ncbi:prefoldin subunit 2 [Bacillus rossius redtenbacheri]|uniref:prefoldin subunit 2 n=1 Tax=Bacillus rossius redtenbacheri TaxID=93214 RepID=UPI002FDE462B